MFIDTSINELEKDERIYVVYLIMKDWLKFNQYVLSENVCNKKRKLSYTNDFANNICNIETISASIYDKKRFSGFAQV